jgi:mono/diheme cytochrome c family protein
LAAVRNTWGPLIIGVLLVAMDAQAEPFQFETGRQTVWDGVYTGAQAARGQAVYSAECAKCHREDLSGYNGALAGRRFMEEWREDHLYSLFNTIRITMPRGAPGSLSDEAYMDIVTYVLQVNGFPEGVEELAGDRLRKIQLIGRDGPRPVPDFALIEVAGCLIRDPAGAWLLSNATDPLRTREPGASSDEELELAKSAPHGAQTYRLVDIEFVRPVFQAAIHEGHKLQAKGFLNRRPSGDQISLTALQSVSSICPM